MGLRAYGIVRRPPTGDDRTFEIEVVTCEEGNARAYLGPSMVAPFVVAFGPAFDEAREHPVGETFRITVDELPTKLRSYLSASEAMDDGKDLS